MRTNQIRLASAVLAVGTLGSVVLGACYQLTDLGYGCTYAELGPDECALSYSTNIQVNGTTDSGTGKGRTGFNCTFQTYCEMKVGWRNEFGFCTGGSNPPTHTVMGTSCVLSGGECDMTIHGGT